MWAKVSDTKIRDQKILHAARLLGGRYGHARVVAVWLEGTLYCNAHGTDGLIVRAVARTFIVDPRPCDVLEVMSFTLATGVPGLTAARGDDYLLVDHLEDQPSSAVWAADRARRQQARLGRRAPDVMPSNDVRPAAPAPGLEPVVAPGPASTPLGIDRLVGVATAAARAVLADVSAGRIAPGDAKDAIKQLLAKSRIPYDSALVNDALDRAERGLRLGPAIRTA